MIEEAFAGFTLAESRVIRAADRVESHWHRPGRPPPVPGAPRGRKPVPLPDDVRARAAAARASGMPWAAIAHDVGVPERSLRRRMAACS